LKSYLLQLRCSGCQQTFNPDRLWNVCPECHKPLLAEYDLGSVKTILSLDDLSSRNKTIWRFGEVLPVKNASSRLSLGEGCTPLVKAGRLGEVTGLKNLYIKDEGINPTGSFKARGLCVAVSRTLELGVTGLSIPSAGNAAGAMSAYAALAGLPANVYLPRDVPQSFLAECQGLGARVNLVEGLISACGKKSLEDSAKYGWFDLSTLKEPYRLEGKKTMGYEVAEQMDWVLPDIIIYPTGGGTGFIGMWKAFHEMEELGWIGSQRPRMVSVQAEGCAPMVKAYQTGQKEAEFWTDAKTIADGLRVPAAIGDFLILDIIRKSNGTALSVSDKEMMEGAKLLGRTQGLFVSPESGATVAAAMKLLDRKWISPSDRVVLFHTGSGYKYSHLWLKEFA
jgi:threonine synthase